MRKLTEPQKAEPRTLNDSKMVIFFPGKTFGVRVARATGGQIQSIAHSKQMFYPRAAYMPPESSSPGKTDFLGFRELK